MPMPIDVTCMQTALPDSDVGLYVTWLAHSSFLIQIDGVRILVDPLFTYDLSPVPMINRRRFFPDLPFEIGDLPFIDAVFISHSHMDHLV
jgi:L-ascorbate metabolism protein UlaG (beta-lactamase superfamily)